MNMSNDSLAQWKTSGHSFGYKGHSIFVKSGGDSAAEVLLLIHGFPTASWDWEAIWNALTARYRVYTLDLIGFGFSDKPQNYHYSIMDQADLCEAYLTSQGVTSYHILAHDLGDSIAQELLSRTNASDHLPILKSVALLNGGLFPETHRPVLIQRILLSPMGKLVARLISRRSLAKNMQHIFGSRNPPTAELINNFWTLITYHKGQNIFHQLIRYIPERRTYRQRWVDALINASVPIKLINGIVDPISGGHMVERYRQLVAQADITELQDIGHYPQIEAPEAVLNAYLEFRNKCSSISSRNEQ